MKALSLVRTDLSCQNVIGRINCCVDDFVIGILKIISLSHPMLLSKIGFQIILAQQTMSSEQFNNDNNMVDSLISILLNNNLETEQTLDYGWIQYKESNCDGTLTMNQNYLAYLKQRLQSVLYCR
jgi:hypothetical protein